MGQQGEGRRTAAGVACRCLTSPLAVAGLALLILNDHWLKQSMPGVWTGKLSDLGGLAFFPFLLALGFALVVRRPVVAGVAAFLTAGVTFSVVKVVPAAAAAASDALSLAVGPSLIRADATDLVALFVLWPAWLLWRREEVAVSRPTRRATLPLYVVLPIAMLATAATSCSQPDSVDALVAEDGFVRAFFGNGTARSEDGGRTWTREEFDADRPIAPDMSRDSPETICADDSLTCYRVNREPTVEVSTDGGTTWSVGWQIPPDRRELVRRSEERGGMCGSRAEFSAVDGELVDVGGEEVFVAALQDEGVVVGTAEGPWHQVAVGGARPEPFTGGVTLLGAETGWTGLVALLVLWTGLIVAEVRRRSRMPRIREERMWTVVGVGITLATAAVVGGGLAATELVFGGSFSVTRVLPLSILAVGSVATARRNRSRAKMAHPVAPYAALAAWAVTWVAALSPFVAWAAGVLTYRAATATSVVVLVVAVPLVVLVAMDRSYERADPVDDLFEPG